jgi:hypothetical protein
MEIFNFSTAETGLLNKALTFISRKEVDFDPVSANLLIVKTENFFDECEQLAPYYANLGLENAHARLVFNPAKGGAHKILINKEGITGLSYIYTVVTQMVHLVNIAQYNAEFGNVYRFSQEQAIAHSYYEFLLWTKFQGMKMGTRAHALMSWHAANGEHLPEGGCYQFARVNFHGKVVEDALQPLQAAGTMAVWREGFWDLLEELAFYFGRLAFYQQNPQPHELDEAFPTAALARVIGLENCLVFYAVLQQIRDYAGWRQQRANIRRAIVAMEEHGKGLFAPGA